MNNHYDVIIIGGRCAGASLAIRLADKNLKILLLDRATFPSLPNVPSSPFVHSGTMRLLDELGLSETDYAHNGAKVERFVVNMAGEFEAGMSLSDLGLDRNYFMGIDRTLFDHSLWKKASSGEGITAKSGFSVSNILKDETGKVTGVSGKGSNGDSENYTADLVVGADGRFSLSARQFGAKVIEDANDVTSATYFADWENVDDYSADYRNAINNYNTGKGYFVLVIPLAERRYSIAAVFNSKDANFGSQKHEQVYLEKLKAIPHLWHRLRNAERTTDIMGMRPIENGYREAFGANWALLGDAAHYKDPSDGQGIYDALLGSKILANCILDWKRNGTAWQSFGASYQQQLQDATYPTFKQTVANVKQTMSTLNTPKFLLKSIGRWFMSDEQFQRNFLLYLAREIPPDDLKLITPQLFLNGIIGDIRRLFRRGS